MRIAASSFLKVWVNLPVKSPGKVNGEGVSHVPHSEDVCVLWISVGVPADIICS